MKKFLLHLQEEKEIEIVSSDIKEGIFKLINDETLSDELFLVKLKDYLIKNISNRNNEQNLQKNNISISQYKSILRKKIY